MKIVRYGEIGKERPALIDSEGKYRELSDICGEFGGDWLLPEGLAQLREIDPLSLPLVSNRTRVGIPYVGIGKMLGIGMNYTSHAVQLGLPLPNHPAIFLKANSCFAGPQDTLVLPRGSTHTDYEVEMGFVIGTPARYVTPKEAMKHVAGYCLVNDVSEREYQLKRPGQWTKGKSCDGFGKIGPWFVSADEIPFSEDISLWLSVNGEMRQQGSTKELIFSVRDLISILSEYFTLHTGDIIITGTPPGSAVDMKPSPLYLKHGDIVALGSNLLGEQRHMVVDWR